VPAEPLTGPRWKLPQGGSMLVEQRPNESRDAWVRRCRIAQNVEKHGIRVVCSGCAAVTRHKTALAGPLRDAECPNCHLVHELKRVNGWRSYRVRAV